MTTNQAPDISPDFGPSGALTVNAATIVRAEDVRKIFGDNVVLKGISMSIRGGEIRGLVGLNGAGKSTLIKILCGVYSPDGGTIAWPVGRRVASVQQDTPYARGLTILESARATLAMTAGESAIKPLSWRHERRRVSEILDRYEITIDLSRPIEALEPGKRAQLGIAMALEALTAGSADQTPQGLLVLDEVSAALDPTARDELHETLRRSIGAHCGVLFVSHSLSEMRSISTTLTVLRDGIDVYDGNPTSISNHEIGELMVGGVVAQRQGKSVSSGGIQACESTALRLEDLAGDGVDGLSLELHEGEILGLTGPPGSCFRRVPALIAGLHRADRGSVTVGEAPPMRVRDMHPWIARQLGLEFVSEDRKKESCIESLTLTENLMIGRLGESVSAKFLRRSSMRKHTEEVINRSGVAPPRPDQLFGTFSGGNQQKALVGTVLAKMPRVIVVSEPTHGVDLNARPVILDLLVDFAANGGAVLCVSDDFEQLFEVADRVVVCDDKKIRLEVSPLDLTLPDLIAAVQGMPLSKTSVGWSNN